MFYTHLTVNISAKKEFISMFFYDVANLQHKNHLKTLIFG